MANTIERDLGLNPRKLGTNPAGPRRHKKKMASVPHMETDREYDPVLGVRFRYWLGLVIEELLNKHHISPERASDHVGLSKESLVNFMNGKTEPHNVEGVVAGIAQLCEIGDPRKLYQDAVYRWIKRGVAPDPSPPKSRRAFGDLPPLGNSPPT